MFDKITDRHMDLAIKLIFHWGCAGGVLAIAGMILSAIVRLTIAYTVSMIGLFMIGSASAACFVGASVEFFRNI